MKNLSVKGNSSPIRNTAEYKERVGKNISISTTGLRAGSKNPNFGGKYTNQPAIRKKMKKPKTDSSNMGRYLRTQKHRDDLSNRASENRQYVKRTKIENIIAKCLDDMKIEYKQEYLIQCKEYRGYSKLFFRHTYDFYLPQYNLLIECDGVYWHNSIQARVNDTKCSYIANAKGFRIIRLDELFILNITNIQLLAIIASDTTFAVFGNFYDSVPTREFVRNDRVKII